MYSSKKELAALDPSPYPIFTDGYIYVLQSELNYSLGLSRLAWRDDQRQRAVYLNSQGEGNGILFRLDLKPKIDKKARISLHENFVSLTVSLDEIGMIEKIRLQLFIINQTQKLGILSEIIKISIGLRSFNCTFIQNNCFLQPSYC